MFVPMSPKEWIFESESEREERESVQYNRKDIDVLWQDINDTGRFNAESVMFAITQRACGRGYISDLWWQALPTQNIPLDALVAHVQRESCFM